MRWERRKGCEFKRFGERSCCPCTSGCAHGGAVAETPGRCFGVAQHPAHKSTAVASLWECTAPVAQSPSHFSLKLHWVNAQCILAYIVTNRRRNQGVCDGTRQDGVVCGMGVRRKDRQLLNSNVLPSTSPITAPYNIMRSPISPVCSNALMEALAANDETANKSNCDA